MHVLRGNIQEAIVTYQEAIEQTTKSNDFCWMSGAKQGMATAIYLSLLYESNYLEDESSIAFNLEIYKYLS